MNILIFKIGEFVGLEMRRPEYENKRSSLVIIISLVWLIIKIIYEIELSYRLYTIWSNRPRDKRENTDRNPGFLGLGVGQMISSNLL